MRSNVAHPKFTENGALTFQNKMLWVWLQLELGHKLTIALYP